MDRRDFFKGAGGLVIIASLTGIAGTVLSHEAKAQREQTQADATPTQANVFYTTPNLAVSEQTIGPVMVAGIDLIAGDAKDTFKGYYSDTHIFDVDKTGAELIMMATGSHSLKAIAAQTEALFSSPLKTHDTAEFFMTLDQAGYLQNQILVTVYENRA